VLAAQFPKTHALHNCFLRLQNLITHRQTDRQTSWSQCYAPLQGRSKNWLQTDRQTDI